MQGENTTNRQLFPASVIPLHINLDALRAEIRAEVLAEVGREAAQALIEVERAANETARITDCREFAAPRYIRRRLNATRLLLLSILAVADEPVDPDDAPCVACNPGGQAEGDDFGCGWCGGKGWVTKTVAEGQRARTEAIGREGGAASVAATTPDDQAGAAIN